MATLVHAVALWAWHLPAWFEAGLHHDAIHALQHACFLGTAIRFWHAILAHPQRARHGLAIVYLFLTAMHSGALGGHSYLASQVWCPAQSRETAEVISHGRIYVPPTDSHLMIGKGRVLVTKGATENRVRPAIDPLFRSAAVAYGSRVIAVVLTGYLDDGTAGLVTVKRCGGTCVAQDPKDATFPSMPASALGQVQVGSRAMLHANEQ